MATTVARNKTDVNNMSAKDRLWDSLNYSYGQKREESDKAYDKAISAQDRQLLSRGMQRSSYGMQTLANMRQEQVNTRNTIYDQQIADYENRLKDIEDTEWQRAFQERQFDEGVRQFDTNLGFQKERAAASDNQWQQTFDYGKERDTVADQQWNTTFNYQKERDAVADSQWKQTFDYGKERDAVSDNQWNLSFNYQKERDTVGDERWEKQFAQDTANNYIMNILASGKMPSDEMLAAAGLSKADAETLRAYYAEQASKGSSGGGPGPSSNPDPGDKDTGGDPDSFSSFMNDLGIKLSEFMTKGTNDTKANASIKYPYKTTEQQLGDKKLASGNTLVTKPAATKAANKTTTLSFAAKKPDLTMQKK